jgi:hypothetical protein
MNDSEPQPTAPPPPARPFQFSLRTLLLLFVVLGSSLAVFGTWGIAVFGLVVGLAIYLYRAKSYRLLILFLLVSLIPLIDIIGMLDSLLQPAIAAACQAGGQPNWSNIAALAVLYWPNLAALAAWLASVGTLLTRAVRSRKAPSVPPPSAC